MNKNDHVIVALFEDQAEAEAAIDRLKEWDHNTREVTLGAIGLLHYEDGEVKALIDSQAEQGLKIGAIVGIIAGIFTGGIGLVGGAAAGGLLGSVTGAFFSRSLNLNQEECNLLGMELQMGKAAVVVTLDEYELVPTRVTLENAGGVIKTYHVPEEAANATSMLTEADLEMLHIARMNLYNHLM